MNRVFVVVALVCVLAGSSKAQAEPPPPDVLVLIEKMRHGGTLTTDEQTKLRAWQQQRAYSAGGGRGEATGDGALGTMPPDIAAIMSKAQRGIPPTEADAKRLKAWGERTSSHEGEILKDEKEKRVRCHA